MSDYGRLRNARLSSRVLFLFPSLISVERVHPLLVESPLPLSVGCLGITVCILLNLYPSSLDLFYNELRAQSLATGEAAVTFLLRSSWDLSFSLFLPFSFKESSLSLWEEPENFLHPTGTGCGNPGALSNTFDNNTRQICVSVSANTRTDRNH